MPKKIQVDAELVKSFINKGLGQRKIAVELGVTRQVIKRVYKELNILHPRYPINTVDSILLRVKKFSKNGCWEWQGPRNPEGYGVIGFNGRSQGVHRIVYTAFKGSIPDHLYVCHKCDNPSCCNPEHLFIGSSRDNQVDCVIKNRQPRSKINFSQATEIRKLVNSGIGRKEVALAYNLTVIQIRRIMIGECWSPINYKEA